MTIAFNSCSRKIGFDLRVYVCELYDCLVTVAATTNKVVVFTVFTSLMHTGTHYPTMMFSMVFTLRRNVMVHIIVPWHDACDNATLIINIMENII